MMPEVQPPVGLLLSEPVNSPCLRHYCSLCKGRMHHVSGEKVDGAVCTSKATVHICLGCDVPREFRHR